MIFPIGNVERELVRWGPDSPESKGNCMKTSSKPEFEMNSSMDFSGVEQELRTLWKQYQACLQDPNTKGLAEEIRNEYYRLFRNYRAWRDLG